MTPRAAANKLRSIQRAIPRECQIAERRSEKIVERAADKLSRGSMTYATMSALDHPYAKRHGASGGSVFGGDPAIINTHPSTKGTKGRFRSGWHLIQTLFGFAYVNDSPVAGWLEDGTKKMIARPIRERITDTVAPVRRKNLVEAVRRAIQ